MVVGVKDTFKLTGIFILSCCAVLVSTLFLNYNMDLAGIKDQITSEPVMVFYDAQVSMGKVISAISGGCLLLTSVIMLFFYIRNYIDTHRKELGILKALGYSNWKIAGGFQIFGLSVGIGTAVGFAGAFILMPSFYRVQNEDKILPEYSVHFHPSLALYLVILPAVFFGVLSVLYSYYKLRTPVLELLKGKAETGGKQTEKRRTKAARGKAAKSQAEAVSGNGAKEAVKGRKESSQKQPDYELPFLQELKKSTVKGRGVLVFFIAFASFCYSAMMQMAFSMDGIASVFFSVMMMMIGIALACTTLFLAITTVINANTKAIAMMRVFGYSLNSCSRAVLGGYRPIAWVGFGIGTVYQYGLLKMVLTVVFKDIENIPEYNFDIPSFVIALISFVLVYELVMYCYSVRIKRISVKEIMLE